MTKERLQTTLILKAAHKAARRHALKKMLATYLPLIVLLAIWVLAFGSGLKTVLPQ
jgi:hypothetical protein